MDNPPSNTYYLKKSSDDWYWFEYPQGDKPTMGVGDKTLSWLKPTHDTEGNALMPGDILSYDVFVYSDTGLSKLGSVAGENNTSIMVSDGKYTVRAKHKDGELTALCEPVDSRNWLETLNPPTLLNTVSATMSRASLQSVIDAQVAGGVVYFRDIDGDYHHELTSGILGDGIFLTLAVNGTADNPITFINYPGETPVIRGIGWANEAVGPAGEQQGLLFVSGSHLRVSGFEITASGAEGLRVKGSNVLIQENHVHDNWGIGIMVGADGVAGTDINGGVIAYNKCHHNRQGSGILFALEAGDNYNLDNWTVKRNICYRNGWNADNTMNVFGGGNSDGIAVTKVAHDDYLPGEALDPAVTGRANRIHNLSLFENICFRNGDDGYDVSSGLGTRWKGNVAFFNGPSGNKGFKILRNHYGDHTYVSNLTFSRTNPQYLNDNCVYASFGGASDPRGEVFIGDVLVGQTSGASATVTGYTLFTNGNTEQLWSDNLCMCVIYLNGPANFVDAEALAVGGAIKLYVMSIGQTMGVDHRANTTESTRPYGKNNEVGWTALNHNTPGDGSKRGIGSGTAASRGGMWANNLSYGNQDSDSGQTNFTSVTNFSNSSATPPGINNVATNDFDDSLINSERIEDQWRDFYLRITAYFMPVKNGNVYGSGTLDAAFYHQTAADDDLSPSDPDDLFFSAWFKSDKNTALPDVGFSQYRKLFPVKNLSVS